MGKNKFAQWPVDKIKPYGRNPRINDDQVDKMAAAIKEFGFRIPVVVRSDGTLIDGHLRLKAAIQLGMETVPVALADELTEAQVKAFRLVANRSANWARWDDDMLRLELADLTDFDFDLELTGFDSDEITKLLKENIQDDDKAETAPEIEDAPPHTQHGNIWILGGHRLMCGDSTEKKDVATLIDGNKADMVFTDPPYGVNIKGGNKSASGKMRIVGDLTQTAIPFSFDLAVTLATKDDARFYFCGGENNIGLYGKLFDRFLAQIPRHLIWVKNSFTMKPNGYHNQYEIIFHGYKQGGGALDKWFGTRKEDAASDVWQIKRDAASTYVHPTQKPVDLPCRAITNSCPPGGMVYEPFCGSGSTLIACEKSGRVCRAMELDPRYCDVIVKRWQEYTGKDAILSSDGRTFAEVANA